MTPFYSSGTDGNRDIMWNNFQYITFCLITKKQTKKANYEQRQIESQENIHWPQFSKLTVAMGIPKKSSIIYGIFREKRGFTLLFAKTQTISWVQASTRLYDLYHANKRDETTWTGSYTTYTGINQSPGIFCIAEHQAYHLDISKSE